MKKQFILLIITTLITSALYSVTIQDIMKDLAATDNQLRIDGLESSTNQNEQMGYLAEWDQSFATAKANLIRLGGNDNLIKNTTSLLDAANTQLRNAIKSLITLRLSVADLTKLADIIKNIAIKVDDSTKSVTQSSATAAVSLSLAMQKSLKRIIDTVKAVIERKKRAMAPPALPPRGTTR